MAGKPGRLPLSYGIVWTDNIFSPVKIELYKGGTYYSTIADTTQSDGYYAWSVHAADSGSDYRVKQNKPRKQQTISTIQIMTSLLLKVRLL